MIGAKTEEYLAGLFADSYKRELDADEAIWRSLPLFAAILGLAVAILPTVYRSAQLVADASPRAIVTIGLIVALGLFAGGARWFWAVIRPRDYRYPPTDEDIHDYAHSLAAFHADAGEDADSRDERTRNELRAFVLDQFALATTQNRSHNFARAQARTQVLLFVIAGFLMVFLCQVAILGYELTQPNRVAGAADGTCIDCQAKRDERTASDAPGALDRPSGRSPVTQRKPGPGKEAAVTDKTGR